MSDSGETVLAIRDELRKQRDALLAACKALADWRGMDENSVITFERIAERFYRETGLLAPGKDAPAAARMDIDARRKAWDEWCERKNDEIDELLRAALSKALPDTEDGR